MKVYRGPKPENAEPTCVVVETWSGNRRPWRGIAYVDGRWVGETGGCKSAGAAERGAVTIIERERAALRAGEAS